MCAGGRDGGGGGSVTEYEVLEMCGLRVRDDHKVFRMGGVERLIAVYEELIRRKEAEINRLRLLLETRDGF
jgi:hypothetical protein